MIADRKLVLFVGVGGQGVITAAEIVGTALHEAGLPVVVGQLHGMSQRGGSVEASVLLGPGSSSLATGALADVLIALEPLEALRALPRVGRHTAVLLSDGGIVPYALVRAAQPYPALPEVLGAVRKAGGSARLVHGPALADRAGAARTLNIVMLGALAGLGALPIPPEALWRAVAERCRPRFLDANHRAFDSGREAVAATTSVAAGQARDGSEAAHG